MTYAISYIYDVCWRMLPYADGCWRMLTDAAVCCIYRRRRRRTPQRPQRRFAHTKVQILTQILVQTYKYWPSCSSSAYRKEGLEGLGLVCIRLHTSAYVGIRQRMCWHPSSVCVGIRQFRQRMRWHPAAYGGTAAWLPASRTLFLQRFVENARFGPGEELLYSSWVCLLECIFLLFWFARGVFLFLFFRIVFRIIFFRIFWG